MKITPHCINRFGFVNKTFRFYAQLFNITSQYRRKSILGTLSDGKVKVKEVLREQSPSLNSFSKEFSFGAYFENEFSKSVNAKINLKSLFIGLKKFSSNSSNGYQQKFKLCSDTVLSGKLLSEKSKLLGAAALPKWIPPSRWRQVFNYN